MIEIISSVLIITIIILYKYDKSSQKNKIPFSDKVK